MASFYRKSEIPEHLQRYFCPAEIGAEPTPEAYVQHLVALFREIRRVLRDDGSVWLNLGDSYAATNRGTGGPSAKQDSNAGSRFIAGTQKIPDGLKPKDLVGIPWRVAFALQADGWYLRSDIIWAKPNPMPESVTDRPTRSHEYIFLLTKSREYYYDADAIKEPLADSTLRDGRNATGRHTQQSDKYQSDVAGAPDQPSWYRGKVFVNPLPAQVKENPDRKDGGLPNLGAEFVRRVKTAVNPHVGGRRQAPEHGEPHAFGVGGRNKRDVWTVATAQFRNVLVRRVGVGGTDRRWSRDCPVHADQDHLDATAECGGPQGVSVSDRTKRNGDGPDQSPEAAPVPTGRTGVAGCAPESSDCPAREYEVTATLRSTESHRTDHVHETSRHGKDDVGSVTRTDDSVRLSERDANDDHTNENNTAEDSDGGDTCRLSSEETFSDNACTCTSVQSLAHFAVFPPALIEPCVLAGCPAGGTVLDPFGGAGTTGLVAAQHGRDALLIELNPEYVTLARNRIEQAYGLLTTVTVA